MTFERFTDVVVLGIEAAGMGIIVIGMIVAFLRAGWNFMTERHVEDSYRIMRRGVGRSLILGIDLLIASEIIRSITAETLENVTVLAATVIVRMFLSFAITVDIEGRVPWRRDLPDRDGPT